jgi:hypothetical protein
MMSGSDIAWIIVAGGIVAGGAWDRVKRLGTDRRAERERLANGPEPICGCGHHLAFHDLHDGRCYAEVKRVGEKDGAKAAAGAKTGDDSAGPAGDGKAAPDPDWHRCTCRRYAGPEPIATMYAPPITGAAYEQVTLDPAAPSDAQIVTSRGPENTEGSSNAEY